MRRSASVLVLLVIATFMGAGPAHAAPGRAVVIVSGGDAVSPFTTGDDACRSGLAAGNTDTALRENLLAAGHTVYTSPAMAGRGPVTDQGGFGAFGDCPITLPDIMTVDSTASIELAGEHLARFLTYLHDTRGVDVVDVVGHSMGGLYLRAAFRVLQSLGSPICIIPSTNSRNPLSVGIRPALVCGAASRPSDSSSASTERIEAGERLSPCSPASVFEPTGFPLAR